MQVAENIAIIEERILKSCGRAGRKRDEITLMGVSKFVPVKLIEEAFVCGILFFGESRVKEAGEKFGACIDDNREFTRGTFLKEARLHLIGSLQRNKVKQAVKIFDCVQSVDRNELIAELIKQTDDSSRAERHLEVLLEIHTAEDSKSGFAELDDLFRAADTLCGCNLKAAGLMTMAPFTDDTGLIRSSFRQVVKAQAELEKRFPAENWKCLSMGMSNDFEIAIEEGSTMLRIGTAVFKGIDK